MKRTLMNMLRLRHIRWLSLMLLAALWPGYLRAGSLEKIWEVNLRKALQGEHLAPHRSFKVTKLLFSPDTQQIAVLLAGSATLFRVQDSQVVLGQIQSGFYDSFGWSPDGQIIHSGRQVVHVADRKACELPQSTIEHTFMGNGSLIALFLDPVPLLPSGKIDHRLPDKHIKFYDAECREQKDWEVPTGWGILDATPERGLVLVGERGGYSALSALIVNPFARKVLHSTSAYNGPCCRFAANGTAICGGNICWDADTGRKIGEAAVSETVSGVSARSSRVVLEDARAARRRVWDFRSGKEVVSWQLNFLTYGITIDLDGFQRDRRPIPCAISADGEYIVEGGDGKIWLYKIHS